MQERKDNLPISGEVLKPDAIISTDAFKAREAMKDLVDRMHGQDRQPDRLYSFYRVVEGVLQVTDAVADLRAPDEVGFEITSDF